MPLKTGSFYEYGSCRLEPDEHRLTRDGVPVPLAPRAFDLLVFLVRNPGRLLTKEEILEAVWPDSFVEEANLTVAISTLRKAMGEKDSLVRYIETVPKKGYRFLIPVREISCPEAPEREAALPQDGLAASSGFGSRDETVAEMPAKPGAEEAARGDANAAGEIGTLAPGRRRAALLLFAILCLGIVAGVAYRFLPRKVDTQPAAIPSQRTLAVLPLRNLKQTQADDYLSFSLADAIITELAPVSSLTVRPSSAIERYKGVALDSRKVATELGVNMLLTGSFIHEGDDLRITYQLIDVKTDRMLAKDLIDLKYDKLMAVQDIVTGRVIQGLALNLPASEAALLKASRPVNAEAYEYYLRGVDKMASHEFPAAIEMLESSTRIDGSYAPAWAYLGQSYNSTASFQFGGRAQYEKARHAFDRALALQPTQVEARIFLANFLIDTGDVEKAVPLLLEAQRDNPTNAAVHWELGYAYRFAGMLQASLAECETAKRIDPGVKANGAVLNTYLYLGHYEQFLKSLPAADDSSFLIFYRGFGEYHARRWQEAAADLDRAWQLDRTLYTQTGKALSDAIAHRDAEGIKLLADLEGKIEQRGVGDPEGTYKIAQAYAVLGEKDSALRMLRSSIEHGFFPWPYFERDPLLANIRNEPQFTELMQTAQRRHLAFEHTFQMQ
jgi:DNA-binding winged helix-turn-helix (wHTH) protein/TolB-like protein/tetratricopeptide (TPR) repeat protein